MSDVAAMLSQKDNRRKKTAKVNEARSPFPCTTDVLTGEATFSGSGNLKFSVHSASMSLEEVELVDIGYPYPGKKKDSSASVWATIPAPPPAPPKAYRAPSSQLCATDIDWDAPGEVTAKSLLRKPTSIPRPAPPAAATFMTTTTATGAHKYMPSTCGTPCPSHRRGTAEGDKEEESIIIP